MTGWFLYGILFLLLLAMCGFLYRLLVGPTIADRVIALDALGVVIISAIGVLSIVVETTFLLDIILLLSILSFIGTIAFAKFLEKGEIIDRGKPPRN